jgi:hypothetical protein
MASRQIAISDVLPLSDTPNYIVGNWYLAGSGGVVNAGQAPTSGSIRLYPAYIYKQLTIDTLGVSVSTVSAGGNVQAAIYANNAATGRPTGSALVSTGSMSTTSAAPVTAAASLQLGSGLYWFATNCDNSTAIFIAQSSTSYNASSLLGSATLATILPASAGTMTGVAVTQTFGTWPDLTGASFTEQTTSLRYPLVAFKVASIP